MMIQKISRKTPDTEPQKKLTTFQKWILALGLFVLIYMTFPAVFVILIGLLPSITILITDSQNSSKITTIGCMNMTGVFICLTNILKQNDSLETFSLADNIFSLVVMLGLAAFGAILYYEVPNLFVTLFKISVQKRLKTIDAKLEKLTLEWGSEHLEETKKEPLSKGSHTEKES